MNQRLITHLRHVDLAVPDFKAQLAFYKELWGLKEEERDSGLSFLAAEGSPENYVVRLRESREKRVDLISFGAQNSADVDALAIKLATDGVKLINEPDKLQTPGGGYGFRFFDCDGRTIEVSSDVESRQHRVIEERETVPVRLSHVVVNSRNPEATRDFYEKHLSFALTDVLSHPTNGDLMWFMRVNQWHHSLAISRGPHTSLNHVSFELRGVDEFMRGTGKMLRAGTVQAFGPGRHGPGDNCFAYFIDPSGNMMEYTTELESIDEDTWHPTIYDVTVPESADQWGTAQREEFLSPPSFNDPDRGAFTAPPI